MKAIRVVWGLIYDDPWLVSAILIALLFARLFTLAPGLSAATGVLLPVLLFLGIVVSVRREIAKKRRATRV